MKRSGATLIEIAIAAGVVGIMVLGFALFQTATVKANQTERDRAFAQQKCMQMMEELKAKVAGDANTALDDYGQADTTYSFMLTTDQTVVNGNIPSTPLSDNVAEKAGYRFVRQIWVRPLPRDKGARQVTVRVFRSDGKNTPSVKAGAIPLASLANIFKSTPNIVMPTQQYDIYSIGCIENSLGKTAYCAYPWADAIESYQNASINYLSTATSGLSMVIRPIRIASYGRDTYYSPVQNDHDYWTWYYDHSKSALIWNYWNTPLNEVYFRPGHTDWWNILAPGYAQSSYWYTPTTPDGAEPTVPTRFAVKHGNTAAHLYENQPFYTYADQYNHAVRYYENIEKEYLRAGKSQGGVGVPNPYLGTQWATSRWYPDTYEVTLRGLLDEMLEGKRKNAIVVNNHGSLFPFIPMRNYSDAAKVPDHESDLTTLASQWGVTAASASDAKDGSHCRLVTHPRALEYGANDVVELRVYPHLDDPGYINTLSGGGGTGEPPAAYRNGMIVLRGMRDYLADWNSSGGPEKDVEVQVCAGIHGVWPGGDTYQDYDMKLFNDVFAHPKPIVDDATFYNAGNGVWQMDAYRWVRAWPDTGSLRPTDSTPPVNGKAVGKLGKGTVIPYHQYDAASYVDSVTIQNGANAALGLQDGDVIIKLKNLNYTPDKMNGYNNKGTNPCKYGLDKDMTLFGMNYFPDAELPDLTEGYSDPDKQPRNSARVRILFKTKAPKAVEVLTTIGDDPNLLHHQAPNRERTWVWVGTSAPETERYQLIGDPRHNPYADTRDNGLYNRYFDNLTTDAYINLDETKFDPDWNRFAGTADGWGPNVNSKGRVDCDVPRYFELWRKALLTANAMLALPTTDAFQVIALGGEYGSWTPGWNLTHSKKPMTGETNKGAIYDEWMNPTLVGSKDKKWCAKPWLGEMYPDDEWSNWYTSGNIASGDYRHYEYQDLDAFKNQFPGNNAFKRTKYLDHWGPMSFFNATTQFAYKDADGTATIAGNKLPNPTDGRAVSSDLKALLTETIHTYRSFSWNDGSVTPPDDWGGTEASNNRTTLASGLASSTNNAYYLAKDGQKAVAPFTMTRGNNSAYFMAFAPHFQWTGANDPYTAMRAFDACVLQGFLDMAAPNLTSTTSRLRLLPRVNVTKPEDDALVSGNACAIEWTPEWTRWDGQPYSRQFATYGTDGTQPTLSYIVKYSEDGKYWRFSDGTYCSNQVGPYARYVASKASSVPALTLSTAGFKSKQYQVRVEAWRVDPGYETTHHSYAQFSINYTK